MDVRQCWLHCGYEFHVRQIIADKQSGGKKNYSCKKFSFLQLSSAIIRENNMSPVIMNSLRKNVTAVQSGLLYNSAIIIMALVGFCFLVYEWLPGARSEIVNIGIKVDLTVAYIFIIDFCFGLFFNSEFKGKKDYLKKNWPDLISSAPITSEVTQVLRLLRIWRALRVLRLAVRIWNVKNQAVAVKDFLTKYSK